VLNQPSAIHADCAVEYVALKATKAATRRANVARHTCRRERAAEVISGDAGRRHDGGQEPHRHCAAGQGTSGTFSRSILHLPVPPLGRLPAEGAIVGKMQSGADSAHARLPGDVLAGRRHTQRRGTLRGVLMSVSLSSASSLPRSCPTLSASAAVIAARLRFCRENREPEKILG